MTSKSDLATCAMRAIACSSTSLAAVRRGPATRCAPTRLSEISRSSARPPSTSRRRFGTGSPRSRGRASRLARCLDSSVFRSRRARGAFRGRRAHRRAPSGASRGAGSRTRNRIATSRHATTVSDASHVSAAGSSVAPNRFGRRGARHYVHGAVHACLLLSSPGDTRPHALPQRTRGRAYEWITNQAFRSVSGRRVVAHSARGGLETAAPGDPGDRRPRRPPPQETASTTNAPASLPRPGRRSLVRGEPSGPPTRHAHSPMVTIVLPLPAVSIASSAHSAAAATQ